LIGVGFATATVAGAAAVCGGLRDGATAATTAFAFAPEAGAAGAFAATGFATDLAAGFGGVAGALLIAVLAAGFDELFAAAGRAAGDFAAGFALVFRALDFGADFVAALFFAATFFGALGFGGDFLTAPFFEAADFDADAAGRFFAALAATFVRDFVTLLRATRRLLIRAGLAPGGNPLHNVAR
jgi:hypothetical protein